jgi:drug/metabolite transporter (DMT)-like permease
VTILVESADTMFSPQSHIVAILFCFGVMVCWGSWPNLRNLSKTEAPIFVILYVCTQWAVILIASMTLGNVSTTSSDGFDNEMFLNEIHNGSFDNILLVMVCGFLNANGDFLCATALTKLPPSIANPIYGGWVLIQGTLLCFLVEKYEGNLYFLFSGVLLAFLGIISLTVSDYYAADPSTIMHSRTSSVDAGNDDNKEALYKPILDDKSISTKPDEIVSAKVVQKWIFVCVLAGAVCGAWAPLSILATTGTGSIQNQYVVMFLFQTGQVIAIPFMLLFYFQFLVPQHDPRSKIPHSKSIRDVWGNLCRTSAQDLRYGCLTGFAVGLGFFFYFSAVDVIPSTISFAISNCAPLVTIFNDVVLCHHLKNATERQTYFMFMATIFFVIAITLMVLADSL